ncbi:MAG: hypothetical protein M3340_10380 [Actinomycetota bacterium]|nr:hypothetical protein [Actinomycetota bacterium]
MADDDLKQFMHELLTRFENLARGMTRAIGEQTAAINEQGALLLKQGRTIEGIGGTLEGIGGTLEGIGGTLEGIGGTLEDIGDKLRAHDQALFTSSTSSGGALTEPPDDGWLFLDLPFPRESLSAVADDGPPVRAGELATARTTARSPRA